MTFISVLPSYTGTTGTICDSSVSIIQPTISNQICGTNCHYSVYSSSPCQLVIYGEGEMGSIYSIDNWDQNIADVTNVIIHYGITTIPDSAFLDKKVQNIYLPETMKDLGFNSFKRCTSLTTIILPSSVTEVDNSCFESCTSLTTIYIESDDIMLYGKSFYNCFGISSVHIFTLNRISFTWTGDESLDPFGRNSSTSSTLQSVTVYMPILSEQDSFCMYEGDNIKKTL